MNDRSVKYDDILFKNRYIKLLNLDLIITKSCINTNKLEETIICKNSFWTSRCLL